MKIKTSYVLDEESVIEALRLVTAERENTPTTAPGYMLLVECEEALQQNKNVVIEYTKTGFRLLLDDDKTIELKRPR